LREYHTPDGALAARERVVYENGSLLSFDVEELQSGAKGKAAVGHRELDNKTLLYFQYTPRVGARTEARNEVLRKDVLINDLIPYFIASHREELMKGSTVKCRFIVLQRTETIGFKLVKESETNWRGQPVVIVRMEPTSLVIAQLVEPVRFTIEMGGDHRILQYIGRTTPMIKRGNKWEDLDAATVFDWTPAPGK
jgi:hypothetical protein